MAPAQMTFPIEPPASNGSTPAPSRPAVGRVAPEPPPRSLAPPAAPAEGPPPTPARAPRAAKSAAKPAKKAPAKKAAARKAPARSGAKRPTPPRGRSMEDRVFAVAGYAVALSAVVVSYSHMYEVAHMAGQGWRSVLLPVSVDALALVSAMAVRRCRRLGIRPDRLVTVSLVVSVAASLAANVVASDPSIVDLTWLRWVVGAWPPLAFLLAELVIKQWHRGGGGVQPVAAPVPSNPSMGGTTQ